MRRQYTSGGGERARTRRSSPRTIARASSSSLSPDGESLPWHCAGRVISRHSRPAEQIPRCTTGNCRGRLFPVQRRNGSSLSLRRAVAHAQPGRAASPQSRAASPSTGSREQASRLAARTRKTSGTGGSMNFLQFAHQCRGMQCSVTSGAVSTTSSTRR